MSKTESSSAQLNFAIISVADLNKSIEFYSEVIGLRSLPIMEYETDLDINMWSLPKGTKIRQSLCSRDNSEVGQVLLIEFSTNKKNYIRADLNAGMVRGFWNINFYVRDIYHSVDILKNKGYLPWSEPTQHQIGAQVGTPIEVIVDGPDGVSVNLVQLPENSQRESIQDMCSFFQSNGTTTKGFTEIVTTSHCVSNTKNAKNFYHNVLGMQEMFSDVLSAKESNQFLRRPDQGETLITFMKGEHFYGKIALSEPLNYKVPNNIKNACPPNIGYFGQGFFINDIEKILAINNLNILYQGPIHISEEEVKKAISLKCPGSDAFFYLLEQ